MQKSKRFNPMNYNIDKVRIQSEYSHKAFLPNGDVEVAHQLKRNDGKYMTVIETRLFYGQSFRCIARQVEAPSPPQ
jgi:hypothetical protein